MNDFDPGDRVIDARDPQEVCAQIMLAVVGRARLLADDRLARRVVESIEASRDRVPGTLWAYVVLPASVRLIVGPAGPASLDAYVTALKTRSAARLLQRILHADDDTLDVVLHYNPVWGGPIYRVWEAGYHKTPLAGAYRLSNAIYSLQQLPVAAGLVSRAADWPYTWVGGAA